METLNPFSSWPQLVPSHFRICTVLQLATLLFAPCGTSVLKRHHELMTDLFSGYSGVLSSGSHACEEGTVPLQPCPQPFWALDIFR
jgi:hypothetical protein